MSIPEERLELQDSEQATEDSADERTLYLDHGRTLAVSSSGVSQIVEVRASSGQVELRVRLTEAGPVLQLDGVKLQISAEDAVRIDCKQFSVSASESVDIATQGEMRVRSEGEAHIESAADVRVCGDKIWLN